ncbi:hypothetical protein MMC16_002082 [Acarospora aff. strigata]|nr:hypothetical protein [Acarospora aff. strigata]
MASTQSGRKVAIVGSGCSGIGALWALKGTNHEVHLYEAADRLGGHINTVTFEHEGHKTKVDTGFIVLNEATYPNFIAFLNEIDVLTVPTEMSFSVSRDGGLLEWAGNSISAVFAQKSNLTRPSMWRMIFDIIRFNQFALDLLKDDDEGTDGKPRAQESIGAYLAREGYSDSFRNDYLLPMTAAVWSTYADTCSLEFPAVTLVRFMWNHHLLSTVSARPQWLTIKGGSQQYIDAVMQDFPKSNLYVNSPVERLKSIQNGKVQLTTSDGETVSYDHVILATHGEQALNIIRHNATEQEKDILSAFKTSKNIAVLHSDLSLMPLRRKAWSSWNYLTRSTPTGPTTTTTPAITSLCLTYWMNLLQHIPTSTYGPVLVTLNPLTPPSPSLTQGTWTYHHPLYNEAAIRAQKLLPRIQNTRGISYVGAWTKYGFHEDGFSSGVKVAVEHLGAKLPFEFVDSTFSRGRRPVLGAADWAVRVLVWAVMVLIWVVEALSGVLVGRRGYGKVMLGGGEL